MKLPHRFDRLFAPNAIYRQLYPPPSIDFRIRCYEEKDRSAVLDLYDSNALDRFPVNHRLEFENFLNASPASLLVADSPTSGVIACGGVLANSEQVHTLCYGFVAPRCQGRGVGSAMTLARLVFATRTSGMHFSVIFAVPKSMSFYQRFHYVRTGSWKSEGKKEYPIGVLAYASVVMNPIRNVLRQRGLLIDPNVPVSQDAKVVASVTQLAWGRWQIKFSNKDEHRCDDPVPRHCRRCVSCEATIPINARLCPMCGWTQPDMAKPR